MQITFSAMAEFVSRRNAVFSACTDLGADLKVRFTFSAMAEFVKWAKKNALAGVLKLQSAKS